MPDIIRINSTFKKELEVYMNKSEPVLRHWNEPELGYFIAESPKVIERALSAGYEPVSLLMQDKDIEGEAAQIVAMCGDIPLYTAGFDEITDITGFKLIRGALCLLRRKIHPTVAEVCKNARRIAVLENVVNPTNVGAVFRSAAALNMDAVILTHNCSDPLYRRSTRVSMGNVFLVPWTYIPENEMNYPEMLNNLGFKTVAMALTDNSVSIEDEKLNAEDRLAVILGTEGEGLLDSTIESCDYTVKIPMSNGVDSLNIAAASAVAFWQLGVRKEK